jgi:hypothetical protein
MDVCVKNFLEGLDLNMCIVRVPMCLACDLVVMYELVHVWNIRCVYG